MRSLRVRPVCRLEAGFCATRVSPYVFSLIMTATMTASRPSNIRDNHTRGRVRDFLREKIEPKSELSFVTAYFTIYGYAALREELETIERLRLLFGEPRFIREVDPDKSAGK